MEQVKTVCLHKNSVISNMPLHSLNCPDCGELIGIDAVINILMQRVAALERAIEYFEGKEFGQETSINDTLT